MVDLVIVGAGDIARKRHIPGIRKAEHGRLFGFYNRNVERTRELAAQYRVKCYESAEEIWEDPSVDAVLISTPPASHESLAVKALEAGKHVLLEKPMTLREEEAERIREAAERSGAKFMMLHVQRFYGPHKKAKELLEQGRIGRLLSCRTFLGNGNAGGGGDLSPSWHDTLFDVAIHRIDLLRYLVGTEAEQVFCHRSSLSGCRSAGAETPAEDHMVGLFQFANGAVGTLISTRCAYGGEDRSTELFGTEGRITTYRDGHGLILERKDGEREVFDFPDGLDQRKLELTDIHERFCLCIEEDTEPPVTVWDGVMSVRLASALERSDREKRWVEPV